MKTISPWRPAVIFAGFLWAATLVSAGLAQTATTSTQDAATPPQTQAQPTQDTAKKAPDKPGVWHRFGEPDSASTSAAGQSDQNGLGSSHAATGAVHAAPIVRQPPRSDRMADLAKEMLAFLNRDRQDPANAAETHGRAQPLRWNEKLAAVALAHSRDMLQHHYFDHVDREGRNPFVRINATGIHWRALAENIAINRTVSDAEASFMSEPRFQDNHRGNILNPEYTDVGIGIVQAPNGDLYITQDFAAISHAPASAGSR
jgi:uncharacterized protein YkwD